MKKIDLGVSTILYPMPVLILGTYDENGTANAMNAAWGGVYDTDTIIVCLSSHKTTSNIRKTGALTISFATKETITASDYVGIVSQNKVPDKIAKAGLHPYKSNKVNAPLFEEYPLTLECEVVDIINEGEDGGDVIAKIVNIVADESILNEKGRVDVNKLHPLILDPVTFAYHEFGPMVAKAYNVGLKIK